MIHFSKSCFLLPSSLLSLAISYLVLVGYQIYQFSVKYYQYINDTNCILPPANGKVWTGMRKLLMLMRFRLNPTKVSGYSSVNIWTPAVAHLMKQLWSHHGVIILAQVPNRNHGQRGLYQLQLLYQLWSYLALVIDAWSPFNWTVLNTHPMVRGLWRWFRSWSWYQDRGLGQHYHGRITPVLKLLH